MFRKLRYVFEIERKKNNDYKRDIALISVVKGY